MMFLRAEEFSLGKNCFGTRQINTAMRAFDHVFSFNWRCRFIVGQLVFAELFFQQKVDGQTKDKKKEKLGQAISFMKVVGEKGFEPSASTSRT